MNTGLIGTARGEQLERIASALFNVERESHRPHWWPRWLWPRFWPFVESDKELRARCRGIIECIAGEALAMGQLVALGPDGRVYGAKEGSGR